MLLGQTAGRNASHSGHCRTKVEDNSSVYTSFCRLFLQGSCRGLWSPGPVVENHPSGPSRFWTCCQRVKQTATLETTESVTPFPHPPFNTAKLFFKLVAGVSRQVGAINTRLLDVPWLDVRAIDLKSQHPRIEERDFFSLKPAGEYDVVSSR